LDSGGSDPESTDQIRSLAPLALRANNRAVTLQDYADLSYQSTVTGSSVGKANVLRERGLRVTLYLAPNRTATDPDPAPGLDGTGLTLNGNPTSEFTTMAADVSSYLTPRISYGNNSVYSTAHLC
jgi:hypothetical protein